MHLAGERGHRGVEAPHGAGVAGQVGAVLLGGQRDVGGGRIADAQQATDHQGEQIADPEHPGRRQPQTKMSGAAHGQSPSATPTTTAPTMIARRSMAAANTW